MGKSIMTGLGAVVLTVAGTILVPALAQPAFASSCNHGHRNADSVTGSFTGNGVNIRTGPHSPPGLSCTSLGQGQRGDGADFHCWTFGDAVGDFTTWSWVRNTRTGVQGWVSDAFLSNGGSLVEC